MGELIDGNWHTGGMGSSLQNGALRRAPSIYRSVVTAPDAPRQEGGYVAEAGRYHLYVSLACPWASRAVIMRSLKGLEPMIGMSVTHWHMGEDGWTFEPGPGVVPDPVNGATRLRDLYLLDDPHCTSRVTVPVLWDKKTNRIVSNESAEIIRMFNSAFDSLGALPGDYYPAALRAEIDALNERIYPTLNNGVYRAGMAIRQDVYDAAEAEVFDTLDWLEQRLQSQRFLLSSQLTEADIRLFTTLVRFDAVYFGHFKCNVRALTDYPNLWAYTRDIYQQPRIRSTVNFDHIKQHYYGSHPWINPTGVVPKGPLRNFDEPTSRGRLHGGIQGVTGATLDVSRNGD